MHQLFNKNGIWQASDWTLLDVQNLEKAVNYLAKNKPFITQIGVSAENDFKTKFMVDFALIKEKLPQVKQFWLRCLLSEKNDISPLYALENLEFLVWENTKIRLELGKFPKLKSFAFKFSQNIDFQNENITEITADDVDNLLFLKELPNLKTITFRVFKGENLNGIETAQNLENLTFYGAKKLTDIQHIALCKKLEFLELEYFDKELDLSPLSQTKISYLYLRNAIKTCDFVLKMSKLKRILIKEILDKDLSPLFASPSLKTAYLYTHKKSYSHSKKEFEERFSAGN